MSGRNACAINGERRKRGYPAWVMSSLALLGALSASAATNAPLQTVNGATNQSASIELRGRVVCLPEEMNRLYGAALPTGHEHLYGFKSDNGAFYTLLRTKYSEALFTDERLRKKELLLKGRVFPNTRVFEAMIVRSIHNGVVQDLYYYCNVCDIEAVEPGACECCQGPTELIEKPLEH